MITTVQQQIEKRYLALSLLNRLLVSKLRHGNFDIDVRCDRAYAFSTARLRGGQIRTEIVIRSVLRKCPRCVLEVLM
jgi:hypothetical protein